MGGWSGEGGTYYSAEMDNLTNAMAAQGMLSSLEKVMYNNTKDYNRHCSSIPPASCLTQGVSYLWCWGHAFLDSPNAIFHTPPSPQPGGLFIVGTEFVSGAADCTRVVLGDKDILNRVYGPNGNPGYNPLHAWESIDHANARFVANLCTKW